MQRNEWLSLILVLVLMTLWLEERARETDAPELACAAERTLVSHSAGASAERCGYDPANPSSDAFSNYSAGRTR
jgi:hypothetical protein